MTLRGVAASIGIAAALLPAGAARAQDDWTDGGEKPPPVDRPARKKPEDVKPREKAPPTRFLAEAKLGPAFSLSFRGVTEFGLQLNFGYAVARDLAMKDDALYLTVSPYMVVGERLTLVAPLGAQYDLPLTMIPYEGISAYARVSVGYAYYKPAQLAFDVGQHGVAVQPAAGARLSFLERFHVGIEPISFDVLSVFPPASVKMPDATYSWFQLYIFGGGRF